MKVSIAIMAMALALGPAMAATTRWHELEAKNYNFDSYVEEFGKSYSAAELETRRSHFESHLKKVLAHNKDTTKSWKMGVNHLSDRSPAELKAMNGYKKSLGYKSRGSGEIDIAADQAMLAKAGPLPASVDWRTKGAVTAVKDQGQCGSCWTFATAETVESHYFLKTGMMATLSEQQVASCSPNPKDCGGTGGCEGGTAEIGFGGIVTSGGLASEWTYPYTSWAGTDSTCQTGHAAVAKLSGFRKLGTNSYSDLITTVANEGPVAISVDAGAWSSYESGVFDGCNQTNPDIDHAVQLVGYGTDPNGGDYWLVRNSWTPAWGEDGYIRLKRTTGTMRCGTDLHPQDGTGCKGGPATVKACGTCAILYDNAVPTMA